MGITHTPRPELARNACPQCESPAASRRSVEWARALKLTAQDLKHRLKHKGMASTLKCTACLRNAMQSLNVTSMFLKVLLQCYPRAHRFQSTLLYSQECSLEYRGFSRAHQYKCSRLLTLRCRQKLVENRVFMVAMHQWATAYELTFSVRSSLSCRLRK